MNWGCLAFLPDGSNDYRYTKIPMHPPFSPVSALALQKKDRRELTQSLWNTWTLGSLIQG